MVCADCEKKQKKVITPDTWKAGARNTTEFVHLKTCLHTFLLDCSPFFLLFSGFSGVEVALGVKTVFCDAGGCNRISKHAGYARRPSCSPVSTASSVHTSVGCVQCVARKSWTQVSIASARSECPLSERRVALCFPDFLSLFDRLIASFPPVFFPS